MTAPIDRDSWPWNQAPANVDDYDAALWYAIRRRSEIVGGYQLPVQDLETWISEQRARRHRDVLEPEPVDYALAEMWLVSMLGKVAEVGESRLERALIDAAWAIDHHRYLELVDRADAHRRLHLAAEAARARHAGHLEHRNPAPLTEEQHAALLADLAAVWKAVPGLPPLRHRMESGVSR